MNINDNFRYLHMGLPEDILRRKLCGDFDGAVRLIDRRLKEKKLPEPLRCCLQAEREMILRLPGDFPYTREEALARIRERIPDFGEEEFDERVDNGCIGWIYKKGEMRFFNRFFETLCKTEPGFARRAGVTLSGAESAGKNSRKEEELERCIGQMKERGMLSRRIRVRASLRLKDDVFVPGRKIRAHLPVPSECDDQSEIVFEKIWPEHGRVAPGDALQRTVCWEEVMEENHEFTVEYSYVRRAVYHDTAVMKGEGEQPDFFTEEQPPHILFTPYIRDLTAQLSEGTEDPLEKARRFYDYITKNMTYTFMPAYFSMENIAENCARNMTGDCGVFALLFLTLCRCAGIPACWQSGLAAEPDFCGAHDWVRFYIAPYGWLYADPSYGVSAMRAGNENRRQFYFGNLDPFRMAANQAFQAPFTVEKEGFRADPYDNQVGEIESEGYGFTYEEFERSKEVLLCQEV